MSCRVVFGGVSARLSVGQWSVTFWLAAQLSPFCESRARLLMLPPLNSRQQRANWREPFGNLSLLDRGMPSVRMTSVPTPKTSSQSAEIPGARLSSFGA